jgi:hypothetical protein
MGEKKSIRLRVLLYGLQLELQDIILALEHGKVSRADATKLAATELKHALSAMKRSNLR